MRRIFKYISFVFSIILLLICLVTNNMSVAAEMKIYFYLPDDWNSEEAYINYWNVPNDVGWPGHKMNFEREATGGKVYSYFLSNSVSSDSNIGMTFSIGNSNYQTVNIDTYTIGELNGKLFVPTQREYITGGHYLTESRIYSADDPIGTEPVEPEEPIDPNEPVDPEEPIDPNEPVDPEEPIDPNEPVDPEEPTDPNEPVKPEEPAESDEPANPEEPAEPNKPVKPEKPTDSTISKNDFPNTGVNKMLIVAILLTICSTIYCAVGYKKVK